MPDARLLDRDPITGAVQWYQFNQDGRQESKDAHTITTVTDIEPVLQANHDERNQDSYSGRKFYGRDFRKVATVPNSVQLSLPHIFWPGGGVKDWNEFKRWYNSSAAENYRTMRNVRL